MDPKLFALAVLPLLLAATPASAGITAAFGGLKPAVAASVAAVCPAPTAPRLGATLARLPFDLR
jgi:hypothetical protein